VSKWIFALVQFFPLSLFAAYAFRQGPPTDDRWVQAFQVGAVAALLQLLIVLPQHWPANRLILAANLYLLGGGLAALTHQWWFLKFYGVLKESGIFLFMLGVGAVATFASSAGFVAVAGAQQERVRRASLWLLAATVPALVASFLFQGNRIWAAVVPVVVLGVLQRVLVHRLHSAEQEEMHNNQMQQTTPATAGRRELRS